jgi:Flp pilus assembly protein TadD
MFPHQLLEMKRLIIFFSTILILFSCATNNKSDNAALQLAVNDYKQGDFITCQSKLQDYTKKFPDDYQGWSFLGTVALELENDSLAKVVLNKAVSLNSKDFKALTGLGMLERKNKNFDKAADYYNKAISINPGYGKAYSSLLIIELKRNNFNKALELGETAAKLDPEDLGIKGNLSVAYHFTKQYDKRDSLIKEITEKGYPYVGYLQLFFNGTATLDDL